MKLKNYKVEVPFLEELMRKLSSLFILTCVLFSPLSLNGEEKAYVDAIGFQLPIGDAENGREAFINLKCTVCHNVKGDPDLPKPVAHTRGPVLGTGEVMTSGEIANAIVSPSHDVSPRFQKEGEMLSGMGDFSDIMTVRQLVDIVAYLKSLER